MKGACLAALLSSAIGLCAGPALGQQITKSSPPFSRIDNYLKMPAGRHMGSTSSVSGDSHGNIWVAERCGANDCAGSRLAPVLEFDPRGNFIKSFGAGQLLFPHSIFIDKADHIWIVDNHDNGKIGDDVIEYDENGRVLKTLGTPGVPGNDETHFNQPSSVLVAPDRDIFVGDGHTQDKGNARIVKFDPDGKFLMQWGGHGSGPGRMDIPHCLAMDSQGRLFVGDRGNNRMDIFDQNGRFIASWSQFSRPSGCYIDGKDNLYVADSESHTNHHPGWMRGVRIGSVKDGVVTAFIPDDPGIDPDKMGTSNGEGVWVDPRGVIYDAEVGQMAVVRYTPVAKN
ncbi:MAG: peptidyl-alpha-hydroxyglycine alpha-amidating lyase family protein [Rhizomicrobium sp.]